MFSKYKSIVACALFAASLTPTSSSAVKNGSSKNGSGRNVARNFGSDPGVFSRKNSKIISFEQALKMIPEKNSSDRMTLRNLEINREAKVKDTGETVYLRNFRATTDAKTSDWMGLGTVADPNLVLVDVSTDRYIDDLKDLIPIHGLTLP